MKTTRLAPEWTVSEWFNVTTPLALSDLRGRVVLLEAFQMLCPGCVARALPQAQRVADLFRDAPLSVIGLHTVFEHHAAMTPVALRAFLHEYRIKFPVGVDETGLDGDPIPQTMRRYAMQGTPTTILIDAEGRIRRQLFGAHDDLALGAELQQLLIEAEHSRVTSSTPPAALESELRDTDGPCGPEACSISR